jgi:hypothetical protein
MKRIAIIFMGLSLLLSLSALGQTCPAERAAEHGMNPFATFHEVVAPIWHEAWPNKDYNALIAAGPKFKEAFAGIAAMKPKIDNGKRLEKFEMLRKELGELVDAFATAAAEGDKDAVYKITPDLHEHFELAASSLLPVNYPLIEGIIMTKNMILETHLPADNRDGIIGSTETLVMKLDSFDEEDVPEELAESADDIAVEIQGLKETAKLMAATCHEDDLTTYKSHFDSFNQQLSEFAKKYL